MNYVSITFGLCWRQRFTLIKINNLLKPVLEDIRYSLFLKQYDFSVEYFHNNLIRNFIQLDN